MTTAQALQLEQLVNDPEIRRAAAKTLKGFCLTYLPHHFPADLSDFFDEMAANLQDHDSRRLEIIGFRGCAKSTMASLALVLWCALEHPDKYPFIIMLADNDVEDLDWVRTQENRDKSDRWFRVTSCRHWTRRTAGAWLLATGCTLTGSWPGSRTPASSKCLNSPFCARVTRGQASINAASVQHELRNNDLILRDYGHLKYKRRVSTITHIDGASATSFDGWC
jgi:hypothetical protein